MKAVWVFCGNEKKNRSGGKAQEVGVFSAKKLQKTIRDGTIRIFLESEILAAGILWQAKTLRSQQYRKTVHV